MRSPFYVLTIFSLFFMAEYSSASSTNDFDLPLYDGWAKETITIPLSFAPDIELSGLEELRFSPGMFVESDPQYWSYLFVWWVDEEKVISALLLEEYLEKYFFGLAREIARFKKTEASGATYDVSLENVGENSIVGKSLLTKNDSSSEIPSLNIKVNQVFCKPQKRLAVIFELSPQQFKHSNWQILSKLKADFRCGA